MSTSPNSLVVSAIYFAPARAEDSHVGLLGWCSFLIDGRLRADGVAVRRKLDGGLTLSWPARTDSEGRRHPYLRPIDDETRRAVEAAVFRELGITLGKAAP